MVVAHRQLRAVDAGVVGVVVAAGGVGHGGEGGRHPVVSSQHTVAVVDLTRNAQREGLLL